MKTISTALQNLLFPTSGPPPQLFVADLYEFDLVGGGTLYYCSGDQDITYNGVLYSAGGQTGPYFDRTDNKAKAHFKVGVLVDQLVFDVIPGSATIDGDPFLQAVHQGQFDGATIKISRALMPTYGDVSMGVILWFVGRVAEVDVSRSIATFTVNSHLELLNINMPRNLFSAGCVNALYDPSCTLNKAAWAVYGTVVAGSNAVTINGSLSSPPAAATASGYFNLGVIAFTSGALAGLSRTIKRHTAGSPAQLTLISPFPVSPSAGDAFTVYPGCDKTQSTCQAKFNNLANFRGFPYVPQAETSV